MKLSIALFSLLMALSSVTSAKINYVEGEVIGVNKLDKTISIIKADDGKEATYSVNDKTSKKLKKVNKGDNVELRVKTAKLDN